MFYDRALEKNAYNHITATYYLLAEQMLRTKRDRQNKLTVKKPETSERTTLSTLSLSPRYVMSAYLYIKLPSGRSAVQTTACSVTCYTLFYYTLSYSTLMEYAKNIK